MIWFKLGVEILLLINLIDERMETYAVMTVIVQEINLYKIGTLLEVGSINYNSACLFEVSWVLS